jgi:hypothetical protein
MRVVAWLDDSPLYLSEGVVVKEGSAVRGYVRNGHWQLIVEASECRAVAASEERLGFGDKQQVYRAGDTVSRWARPARIPFVVVPNNFKGDYQKVIEWAESKRGKDGFSDLLDFGDLNKAVSNENICSFCGTSRGVFKDGWYGYRCHSAECVPF